MRHKQRPIKSSRHKSVTSLNDCPQTSFEHNTTRHMNDVMRLAFLENNDISPDTWKEEIDFNSLSTATILKRNIQQHLQQQLKEQQSQLKQQQQQQQLFQQQLLHQQQQLARQFNNYEDDYGTPECQIFLTDMPTTSYGHAEQYDDLPMDLQPPIPQPQQRHVGPKRGSRKSVAHQHVSSNVSQMSAPELSIIHAPQAMRNEIKQVVCQSGGFLCDEPDCGKTFPSLRKLRHHKVVHSDEFPFVCQFKGCGKKFKRKFGIDLHSTTHFDLDPGMYNKTSNNSSLPFFGRRMQYSMCKPCNVKFKTVHEYQFHMTKHGKEAFKCPVKGCGQTFNIWKSFQKHRASHYFNYYCKLDPQCDHSTSNLQLLKLHIYCCHFQRKLPANATLSSKDPPVETPVKEEKIDIDDSQEELPSFDVDEADQSGAVLQDDAVEVEGEEEEPEQQQPAEDSQKSSQKSTPSTPRRDPRLRRNPPRSSTFGQQDYASMSNGISLAKLTSLSPPVKKQRVVDTQTHTPDNKRNSSRGSATKSLPIKRTSNSASSQTTTTTSTSPKKGTPKLPVKVLPKRSAQRLPMSMIAAEERTDDDEDDEGISDTESSLLNNGSRASNHTGDSINKLYECHLCDYVFNVRFQLIKHLSTHLELSPEMYSATADAKVIQLSERRRREFYCDKCPGKFESMSELDVHVRKHGPRPYVCTFCPSQPSTFRYAKQYLSHLYEHRFNYKCCMQEDCDFTINRKDALKLHIFRIHLNHQLPAYIENYASMGECNNEWSEQ